MLSDKSHSLRHFKETFCIDCVLYFFELFFCAWLFLWEEWVFRLGLYGRGWSSCRSGEMATLCSVNGIWQNYPQLVSGLFIRDVEEAHSEVLQTIIVKRCQRPWLSRSFLLKHLTWPLWTVCQSCSSSLQIWLTYWKLWAAIRKPWKC